MGPTMSPDHLLDTRGVGQELGAFVVAAAFARGGASAAFALGDGTVHIAPRRGGAWRSVAAHDGACLALAPDAGPDGYLSGGDDGRLRRIGEGAEEIAGFGMKWVEQVASFADAKAALRACVVGRQVHLFDAAGTRLKSFEHPSTVTGIAFDARGKRIGAAHYNGASLWFVGAKTTSPRRLEWKGSHTGIAISPDGDCVVTAMQENALHGWRLSDGQHMRMTGYPAKTQALGFTPSGRWLATAGAEAIVLWPFFGGGPMGKPPIEMAGGDAGVLCTLIACHPEHEVVAAGFSDGLVLLAEINQGRVLPVCGPGRGPVSALAWSGDGAHLAFGTETGFAALIDFSSQQSAMA
jgi:WD40 repeat protein